jgi:LuxR family maltose regulon positive regulatory protein
MNHDEQETRTGAAQQLRRSWLRPPRPHVELVERHELLGQLRATTAPLILVSAAAGWGKSTVLQQWTEVDDRPWAWLQLDAAHDDPVVFLAYLTAALEQVARPDPVIQDLLALPVPPVQEHILPALSAAVAAAPAFLLVLDDGQAMGELRCWNVVTALLDDLPHGAQIAVGTRDDPSMPLARLRAAGALAEVRSRQLAFGPSEAQELLRAHDQEVDATALNGVLVATEGWAAGLYLATLAGGERPVATWPMHVSGDQRDIAAYLAAEVLDRQPDDVRDFLLRTSILDCLDPAICHVISGRADAHDLLSRLARENLFVLPLDERGENYRYHHLFAEFLRAELERREPNAAPLLHTAAATYRAGKGELDAAVRHWLDAGDVDAAAAAVSASWPRLWTAGQRDTVRRWLSAFTDDQILDRVPLTLTAGWVFSALDDVELGTRWGRAACSCRADDSPSPDGAASLRASQALLRATLALDGVARMREDAELAVKLEARPGSSWYADAMATLGTARWLTGSPKQAVRPLRVAAREGAAFNPSAELAALGTLSLVYADLDEWDEAAARAEQAAARLAQLGYGTSRRSLPLLLAQARVRARAAADDLPALVESIGRLLDRMVPHPWMTVMASVILGEACIDGGDVAAAAHWSARTKEALRRYPDAGMLFHRGERLRQAIEAALHTDPLTPAERRVLEQLPTHRTEEMIAQQLFVSLNTVKTHLRSLYRKLGVRSRADAVERARSLGLLPPL